MKNSHKLSAVEVVEKIRNGSLTAEVLMRSCLDRVLERDELVKAWAHIDERQAIAGARNADAMGNPGPLAGIPIGVKDIIDTADMPTCHGSTIYEFNQPTVDAAVVNKTRSRGGVIMGKTVTTEFAWRNPGATCNPHNLNHTPGGSSSGSAAAVAAGMVPLALGTQTNGSVIRPASYCGVYGFKPTHGLIPRGGVLRLSRTLDHVGVFARTLEDIALAAEQLVGHDPRDPDTRVRARIPFVATAAEEPPFAPMLAFVKGPAWDRAEEATKEAFAELVAALGDRVVEVDLPQ